MIAGKELRELAKLRIEQEILEPNAAWNDRILTKPYKNTDRVSLLAETRAGAIQEAKDRLTIFGSEMSGDAVREWRANLRGEEWFIR